MPHKKPINSELSKIQKQENKEKSQVRVIVEHAISGIKRLNIVSEKCRLRSGYARDLIMQLSAGIWNYFIAI